MPLCIQRKKPYEYDKELLEQLNLELNSLSRKRYRALKVFALVDAKFILCLCLKHNIDIGNCPMAWKSKECFNHLLAPGLVQWSLFQI